MNTPGINHPGNPNGWKAGSVNHSQQGTTGIERASNTGNVKVPGVKPPKAGRAPRPVKVPGIKTRAPKAPKARGGRGGGGGNPLLNPSVPLSGNSLKQAAIALANAQITGPITELQQQQGQNQAHAGAVEGLTAGYYKDLGNYANQSYQYLAGQNSPFGGLANVMANANNLGVAGARPQNTGAFGDFNNQISNNYRNYAASELGTYALGGQEQLGRIAQAGLIQNQPLSRQIAGLEASRGALIAANEGKLRQQEITNQVTAQGLGLKAASQSSLNQYRAGQLRNQAAKIKLDAQSQKLLNQYRAGQLSIAQYNSRVNAAYKQGQLSNAQRRTAIAAAKASGSGGGGGAKPLTTSAQGRWQSQLGTIQSLINDAHAKNITSPQAIRSLLINGKNPSRTKYDSLLVQAAFELMGWGHITPATAREMHSRGYRGGFFRGSPIKVAAPPARQSIGVVNGVKGLLGL